MLLFFQHLFKRFLSQLLTFFIITALLYATAMLTPVKSRATLYLPPRVSEKTYDTVIANIIEKYHLDAPYPVQYYFWMVSLFQGNWGYSPTLNEEVFSAILQRAPATAELILLSILVYIPLGIISGVIAGHRKNRPSDHLFRFSAFTATSLPPFILAILMMAIFYINLHWFAPERFSSQYYSYLHSDQFHGLTGFMILDGLLNGRPDISLDALRHLVMPVITLALAQWATLGRITRATMIEEANQDYVMAARARGVTERSIVWQHMLRNAISPAFSSSMVSAASLLTGVFVSEIIFNYPGISYIAVQSMGGIPDAPASLGFAVFSVILVLILMSILDLVQYSLDPRLREKA
ncbi:ABC-type dipeptide/oligopeptide/nickel transport system, permease component [Longilinea arvoryzae]|uniref:ABC-type dipeptide/oligopeptide/nickel transport system, permease component n=1 Tax=Longilinea arvoryzae TaxID=360412 RepID=A0A0S7BGQ3_9CHLR|nr:ABC transporter permease [Longilinea arvoryzae]GAP13686.1 ABC-type dipeptide/oligopeptide/nickel transport system, permease component [Longilinea arvoryzae]